MNKVIPSILVITVLVAGIFAFMPVYEATAVHTTIQNTQSNLLTLTATVLPDAAGTDQIATWTLTNPFEVVNIIAVNNVDAGPNNNDLAASVVTTNLIATAWITEPNPAAFSAAAPQSRQIIDADSIDGDANEALAIIGTTTLAVSTFEGLNFDTADSVDLVVIIKTTGDQVAPAAALT